MGGRGSALRGGNTPSGKTLRDFQSMDLTEAGKFWESLGNPAKTPIGQIPEQLNRDSEVQDIVYALGLNGKPEVVSDDELDAMIAAGAEPIYRGTPELEYAEQMLSGDLSWMGRGIFGDGLYFSTNQFDASGYGRHTVRAVLNKNAKIIDYSDLTERAHDDRERARDSGVFEAEWMTRSTSSMALHYGYNVVRVGHVSEGKGYYVVLDRSALTASGNIMDTWRE